MASNFLASVSSLIQNSVEMFLTLFGVSFPEDGMRSVDLPREMSDSEIIDRYAQDKNDATGFCYSASEFRELREKLINAFSPPLSKEVANYFYVLIDGKPALVVLEYLYDTHHDCRSLYESGWTDGCVDFGSNNRRAGRRVFLKGGIRQ